MKELEESKRQAEKALAEELSLKSFARKGAPAKEQKSKNPKAQDAQSSASGADSRVKEQLSHSNRQLQAMANQVRALGATPVFVKRPNQGNNSDKGSSSSKSSRSSNESSDKSSRGRNKTKGGDRAAEAKAKAGKSDANKAKDKPKSFASSSSSSSGKKDLSHITCSKCKKTGHYANKCPDKAKGSPGRSPPASSNSSSSSKSLGGKGTSKGNGVCHFHKPWRSADRGGPKRCTNGDKCNLKHAGSQAEYDKLNKGKKPAQKGAVAIHRGLVARFFQPAIPASNSDFPMHMSGPAEYASPPEYSDVNMPQPCETHRSPSEDEGSIRGSKHIYFYRATGGMPTLLGPPPINMHIHMSRHMVIQNCTSKPAQVSDVGGQASR